MRLRRKKNICLENPSDDILARLVEQGIESFTIHKANEVKSICFKNSRRHRKMMKKLGYLDLP